MSFPPAAWFPSRTRFLGCHRWPRPRRMSSSVGWSCTWPERGKRHPPEGELELPDHKRQMSQQIRQCCQIPGSRHWWWRARWPSARRSRGRLPGRTLPESSTHGARCTDRTYWISVSAQMSVCWFESFSLLLCLMAGSVRQYSVPSSLQTTQKMKLYFCPRNETNSHWILNHYTYRQTTQRPFVRQPSSTLQFQALQLFKRYQKNPTIHLGRPTTQEWIQLYLHFFSQIAPHYIVNSVQADCLQFFLS